MDTTFPDSPSFTFEDSYLSSDKRNFYLQKLSKRYGYKHQSFYGLKIAKFSNSISCRSQEIILEESTRDESSHAFDRLVQYVLQVITEINQDLEDDVRRFQSWYHSCLLPRFFSMVNTYTIPFFPCPRNQHR